MDHSLPSARARVGRAMFRNVQNRVVKHIDKCLKIRGHRFTLDEAISVLERASLLLHPRVELTIIILVFPVSRRI